MLYDQDVCFCLIVAMGYKCVKLIHDRRKFKIGSICKQWSWYRSLSICKHQQYRISVNMFHIFHCKMRLSRNHTVKVHFITIKTYTVADNLRDNDGTVCSGFFIAKFVQWRGGKVCGILPAFYFFKHFGRVLKVFARLWSNWWSRIQIEVINCRMIDGQQ